ncbi:hypothetical protein [Cuspidothrix issatschenkoi]|uniref:Uncharacterized protein n=1 Tax=Cuspidothrix issatschenkoi CHARLIE-1 TaxID=2052836 RepID=A0A2S6CPJ7_9CYAN|nr:hypothetical protein [Cuspidothrix issatschenkoi]PPJ61673.1 hypothetical protein CUN59_19660 [Cuspidothrix issatschenkoi CHARLIE-1]
MLFIAWICDHRTEITLKGNFSIPKNKKEQVTIEEKPIKDWVTTNVLDKPKDFVNEWILTSGKKPQLIRSQPVVCPEIPARLKYVQAQKLLKEIELFINSADPNQAQVEDIKPKKQQILAQVHKINQWFKVVEETENLPSNIKLETLISLYSRLQEIKLELSKPKTINLVSPNIISSVKSDTITVDPSAEQYKRQTKALEIIHDKINEVIAKLGEKAEYLKTEQELGGYSNFLTSTFTRYLKLLFASC